MTFGETMRALMAERGISLRKLAAAVPADLGYLSKISRDLKPPSKVMAERIDAALDAGGALASSWRRPESRRTPGGRLTPDDEERRRLLACLTLLGVDTAAHSESLEPIRQSLASALPSSFEDRLVPDWEEIAFEHGHAFLTTPPAVLLPDLAADLVSLQEAIRSAGKDTQRRDLCAPAGKMAALMAMTVGTLGQRRHARDWWRTARHAADASEDRGLRVWVRGYEAMNALYSQRPVSVVLRLADEAIAITDDAAGAEALEAMASRAQALSMMDGRTGDARDALRALEARFVRLPSAVPDDRLATGAWPETALYHTAAFAYTHIGDSVQAERAQSAALCLYPTSMQRQRAQIELLWATRLVKDGDVLAGLEHAAHTVAALAADQRTTTIRRGARMVVDAVPKTERSRIAVREHCNALVPPVTVRSEHC